jgi:hypothetical protein
MYEWDPNKTHSTYTLSNGNRTVTATVYGTDQSAISDWSKTSGKWYWEIELGCVVKYETIGICDQSGDTDFNKDIWTGYNESWAVMATTPLRKYHDGTYTNISGTSILVTNDVVMVAVDIDNGKLWIGVNGTWLDSGDPANGTNPLLEDATIIGNTISACITNIYADDEMTACFCVGQQTYGAPSGFLALDEGLVQLEDASLDLAMYGQFREDLAAFLRAHDGIELYDLKGGLEAAKLHIDDISTFLSAWYERLKDAGLGLETIMKEIIHVGLIRGGGAPYYLGGARGVYVQDGYAYVVGESDYSLSIFDISAPLTPTHVASLTGSGPPNYLFQPSSVCVDDRGYAYVTTRYDKILTIFDVSDPANPSHVGVIGQDDLDPPHVYAHPWCVFVKGDYAYVVGMQADELLIIDVSDPSSPVQAGFISGSGSPNYLYGSCGVFVEGSYAYVTSVYDDALSIFDVSNPAAPTLTAAIVGGGAPNYLEGAYSVFVKDGYAYVASWLQDALSIFDVSNPAAPAHVGVHLGIGDPEAVDERPTSVFVDGNFAYVTNEESDTLTILDVSDPASPTLAASITGAGSPNYLNGAYSVFIEGSYAYVASKYDSSLNIFNKTIMATSGPIGKSMMMWLAAQAIGKQDLRAAFGVIAQKFCSLAVMLAAADALLTQNLAASLAATDGLVIHDAGLALDAVIEPPAFRTVTAQRVASIVHEVS